MALRVPVPPRISEAEQLLAWEAELETRWSQLQARRRAAEQLREKQMLLEASLRELDNENVAAAIVLEERRRTLSARQAQQEQEEVAQKRHAVEAAAEERKRLAASDEETHSIDAAWRELERATQHDDATHTEGMRALQWTRQCSLQRETETRARLDAVREREATLLARSDALKQRRQHSTELIRQTLVQLQRELDERQTALPRDDERTK